MHKGFVPMRKPGKLPGETRYAEYKLEYGTDRIEVHADAIAEGEKILLIDDLLATGGTMKAACELVEQLGGTVAACCFLIELSQLNGKRHLTEYDLFSLIIY
jgi:adenine phosphoribosyltransferase